MIVLGIDPGTRATGFGVIEVVGSEHRLIDYGVIKVRPPGRDHSMRLSNIHDGNFVEVARSMGAGLNVRSRCRCTAENPQSMLKLGRAQAAAMLACDANRQVPIVEYTPKEVKKSVTGNGNASKDQVWFMVQKILLAFRRVVGSMPPTLWQLACVTPTESIWRRRSGHTEGRLFAPTLRIRIVGKRFVPRPNPGSFALLAILHSRLVVVVSPRSSSRTRTTSATSSISSFPLLIRLTE